MPGIIPSLKTYYVLSVLGLNINTLPLAFIAPLGTDYNYIGHKFLCSDYVGNLMSPAINYS